MAVFFYFTVGFSAYMALTAGSGGTVLFWSVEEIIVGIVVNFVFAVFSSRIIPRYVLGDLVNPLKWIACHFLYGRPVFPFTSRGQY